MKEYWKKLLQYIKENKLYLIVMLIGSIAFILQMRQVVLYADDFSLGIISKGGFKEIWSYFTNNYMNWGGGLTVIWATTFLLFDIGVWKVFQCILIISTVILATRMITYKNNRNKPLVAGIIWLCIYVLTIWISREVLFWLDGGLAYEFTAFQVFLYFYYLYTRLNLKIQKKYDKILLPIVAFLAGWSSAQSGPIAVVMPVLIIAWQKFIKKEKIQKFYYLTFIIGIIGFAIFYFAPGNSARMNSSFQDYSNYNVIQKIMYRANDVYGLIFNFKQYQFMGIPFYMILFILLNSFVGLNLYNKEENKKMKTLVVIISYIQIIFVLIGLFVSLEVPYADKIEKMIIGFENLLYAKWGGNFSLKILIPYGVASIIMISSVIEAYLIGLKKKDPILVITLISALIMQGVMVMAPYSPLRTTYYTIMFLWIAIAYLMAVVYENKINLGINGLIVFCIYNFQLGIFAIITYCCIKEMLKTSLKETDRCGIIAIITIMLILSCGNYYVTIEKYTENKVVYEQNINRIKKFKEKEDSQEELALLAPKDEIYGFTAMTGIEWVENAIKSYFDIDQEVVLKTEVMEEE